MKTILQLFLGTLIMAAGLGLTVNFLNGLLIIGVLLIVAGATVLVRLAVYAR